MSINDPTRRFSNRVTDYVRYRPSYPPAVLDCLREECGLTETAVIVDIGSGTGILTELFLKNSNLVFGIEPNDNMRAAAESRLSRYTRFTSINATAEATGLPDSSVDFVTAGQAFHWFDTARARVEFRRILRPDGWVALVWNSRAVERSPFMGAYEAIVDRYSVDYKRVHHRTSEAALHDFFGGTLRLRMFANVQSLDFAGLQGRTLSSSYAPLPGHPNHAPLVEALEALFEQYAEDGRIQLLYETRLYWGRP